MRKLRWWQATCLVFVAVGAALPVAGRMFVGPPGGVVHVRWQASLDAAARGELERRFRLTEGERLDDRTWRYALVDPSVDNIRALLTDAAVADTHDIDRGRYALEPGAPRIGRRQRFAGGSAVVGIADALATVMLAVAVLVLVLGVSGLATTPRDIGLIFRRRATGTRTAVRTVATRAAPWLTRGIPALDARTAGIFRIVFGLAVVCFFALNPVNAARLGAMFDPQIEGDFHALVMRWLTAHPNVVDLMTPWLLATGAAFIAGIFTRMTYGLFVAGAVIWAFAAVAFDNVHPHGTLILTLVALLPSRWGDAVSLDAWRRRDASAEARRAKADRGGDRTAGKHYGYSVWVPVLVCGVAFAAAAWAKLSASGISWILNGSVKYHFIADAANAPVDWGLQLAAHPVAAILASLGAVLLEAAVITAAFSRSERYRLIIGVGALALLGGFRLFMGVFWPGWWILLLGFLPWQTMSRSYVRAVSLKPHSGKGGRLGDNTVTAAQLAAIALVIVQQIVVSALAVERAPMFSNYPMYAGTFASPAAFNAAMAPYYRIVVSTDDERIDLSCNASEDMVDDLRAAIGGSAQATATVWRAVLGCRPDLTAARQVWIEEDARVFDWDRLTFRTVRAVAVIGPLAAASTVGAPAKN